MPARTRTDAVLGADVGGTTTRVVLARLDGTVLAKAIGPGANPRSSPGSAGDSIGVAVRAALSVAADRGPFRVHASHLGISGAGSAGQPHVLAALSALWSELGMGHEPSVGTDVEIAYASATDRLPGLLLLAGTGAIACRFEPDGADVPDRPTSLRLTRRCDGMGWLLGDEGSGVWIGLRGLCAVGADLDGRGPRTALTTTLLADLDPGADPRQDLIAYVDTLSPAEYGGFAGAVLAVAEQGDEVASTILVDAAEALVRAARQVAETHGEDVVLAGSLLTRPTPVAQRVAERLTGDGHRLHHALAPVAGAVRFALGAVGTPASLSSITRGLTEWSDR